MDLLQLRCFVTIAEHLSYRRAAEVMGYSTSHLSQQIRRAERSLGVALFVRSTHRVALTPAGQRILPEARDVLSACERIAAVAQGAARGAVGALDVHYTSGSAEAVARCVREFTTQYPDVDVSMCKATTAGMLETIRDNPSSVGFTLSMAQIFVGLNCVALSPEPLAYVALPPDHPLAVRSTLTLADLDGQRLLLPGADVDETHGARVLEVLDREGVHPDYRFQHVGSEEDVIDLVSAGLGIFLVAESTFRRWGHWPGVQLRRLRGTLPSQTQYLVWHGGRAPALTREFLRIACEQAER